MTNICIFLSVAHIDSEEKPLVDFSNLKRETEEIEKLKRKNQYEITSNWGRYEVSEKNESLVYDSEEPADILRLLQTPSSREYTQ